MSVLVALQDQGQVPYRSTALMMSVVLAVTAATADASTLSRPNAEQIKIAPLTLTYGDQPVVRGQLPRPAYQLLVGQWPLDLEPRLDKPNAERVKIAPLTLTYGDQPTPQSGLSVSEWQVIQSWQPGDNGPQSAPKSLAWSSVVSQTPYFRFPYDVTFRSWPAEEALSRPNAERVKIAPLTLTYGDQPTPQPSISQPEWTALQSWPRDDWSAQRFVKSNAWQPPPIGVPYPIGLILASWPADLEPRLGKPNAERVKIAPLTLVYGDQPVPQAPLSAARFQSIRSWPVDDWAAQHSTISTAWLTLPSWNPFVPFQYTTILANVPSELDLRPHPRNVSPVKFVPLTLVYGDQPIPQGPLNQKELQRILSWPPDGWAAQSAVKSLSWVIPVLFPRGPLGQPYYQFLVAQWDVDTRLSKPNDLRVKIAPLTLAYGSQPIPSGPISVTELRTILEAWPTDLEPRLGHPNEKRVKIAPLTLTYGDQPRPRGPLPPVDFEIIRGWPRDDWSTQRRPITFTKTEVPTIPPRDIYAIARLGDGTVAVLASFRDPFSVLAQLRTGVVNGLPARFRDPVTLDAAIRTGQLNLPARFFTHFFDGQWFDEDWFDV